MGFKEWLKINEVGTSTADVAGFQRIAIPLVRRGWGSNDMEMMSFNEPTLKKKKSKSKKQPQIKD